MTKEIQQAEVFCPLFFPAFLSSILKICFLQPFVIFWPSLVSFTIHPSAAI